MSQMKLRPQCKRPWSVGSRQAEPATALKRRAVLDMDIDMESKASCSAGEVLLTTSTNVKTNKELKLSNEEAEELVWEYREFLKDPNIVCLDVGVKNVNGKETDRQALIFHVVKKLAEDIPEDIRRIPDEVQLKKKKGGKKVRIPTDVVETGRIVCDMPRAEGGSAICVEKDPGRSLHPPGTLSAILPGMFGHNAKAKTRAGKKKKQLITCAHLIDYEEQYIGRQLRYLDRDRYVTLAAASENTVYEDFFGPNQVLFPVTDFYRIKKYRQGEEIGDIEFNESDILWADVPESELKKVSSETILGEPFAGIKEADPDETFTLAGITSGEHTNCRIKNSSVAHIKVDGMDSNGGYSMFWKNLISYDLPTRPGDSGASLISEADRRMIGIHAFGYTSGFDRGYACKLRID